LIENDRDIQAPLWLEKFTTRCARGTEFTEKNYFYRAGDDAR
jgi:hypothetical protein